MTTALVLGAGGCKGDGSKPAAAGAGSAAAKPAEPPAAPAGCGADYGDPLKEFCVPIAAGYTLGPIKAQKDFFSEQLTWTGSDGKVEINVNIGKKYDEVAKDKADEAKSFTPKADGKTPGDAGQWWDYVEGGMPRFRSVLKSSAGNVVECFASSGGEPTIAAAAVAACKGFRPFPKS